MALHLQHKMLAAGSWTDLDLEAARIGDFICKFSDSAPASLEFSIVAPQHTFPIALRDLVRFWDDAGTTPDAVAQSESNPLFEGFIWECEPAESNLLKYVAYDPSMLSGKEIPVMSTAWDPSAGVGLPPEPGTGAVPRLIFNATIDNDVDYAFSRADNQTVGQMIAIVLDDALEPLRWYQAAPGLDVAYQTSDLATFDFRPQEKIVSTNESIRAFLDRLTQQHYPEFAFRWDPGTHYWRWYSRLAGAAVTLTLNDPAAANTVLSMELHRSLEGRYPAIKFYGPETNTVEIFSTLDGSLEAIDPPLVIETYTDAGGTDTVEVHGLYQIVDVEKRRGAKLLPQYSTVRDDDYHWVSTRSPMFEISFDLGNSWRAVESVIFDFQNGIVTFGEGLYTYFWTDHPPAGSTQHFFVPNAFRVIWAPFADPITVRRPATGFVGTSHTVAGQTSEMHIYDEMLSVGTNRIGTPVTTASRVAQYQKLGDAILAARKDIVHTGGCVLEGLRYEFCRMGKNVNIEAVDADGTAVITGWESINAVVSDVEYNFAEQTTTLTFSQEALNIWGDNVDTLKARLKIGLMERIRIFNWQYTWGHFESKYANKPGGYNAWTGLVYNDYDLFWDRNAGTFEEAL